MQSWVGEMQIMKKYIEWEYIVLMYSNMKQLSHIYADDKKYMHSSCCILYAECDEIQCCCNIVYYSIV